MNKERICQEIITEYRRFNNNESNPYWLLELFYNCKFLLENCEDLKDYEKKKLKRIMNEMDTHFSKMDILFRDYRDLFDDFVKLLPSDDNLGSVLKSKVSEIHRKH